MLNHDIRAIAPAGYVRACFSKRLRGHCLPLELVRRHLGAVNRGEFRRRVRREFAGYLVTEPAVVVPEIWRDGAGRVTVIADDCRTGGDSLQGLRKGFEYFQYGAALDACGGVAIGCCRKYERIEGVVCSVAGFVGRES